MAVGRTSGWFVAAVLLVAALTAGVAVRLASLEWFSRDDFPFLLHVQQDWSGWDAFLPLESRFWWAWRPLGMDAYFYALHRAFGLEFAGWLAVALGVHFARFPLVWRLARQLDLRGPAPWVAAALSVGAAPSLTELYYPAVAHYGSSVLLATLSLTLLLDAPRDRWLAPAGSAVAFAAALLCNESALLAAPVGVLLLLHVSGARDVAGLRRALPGALRRAAPHLALAALWGVLRFAVIAPKRAHPWYEPHLGGNVLLHLRYEPAWLAGGDVRLVVALALLLAAAGFSWRRSAPGHPDRERLLRALGVLVPWLLGGIAFFATLPLPQVRFAIPLEVPAALLVAAVVDALWRGLGDRHGAALQLACVAGLLLALPVGPIRARMAEPRGALARDYVEAVTRAHPELPEGARIRILYGGEGRAREDEIYRFRIETYMGLALRAAHPGLGVRRTRFVDVSAGAPPPCRRCIDLDLGPDLRVRPAADRTGGAGRAARPPAAEPRR